MRLLLTLSLFVFSHLLADATIIRKDHQDLLIDGELNYQASPCCSFNIALSLMGFDSGFLIDENLPVWDYPDENLDAMWKMPHDPMSWMQRSCLWYSKELAKALGKERMQDYLTLLNYGNQLLAEKHEDSWLLSCFLVTARDQMQLLERFLARDFPLDPRAYELTKAILYRGDFEDGWSFFGKGGAGIRGDNTQIGWYIGWIEKGDEKISFVRFIEDFEPQETFASHRALAQIKEMLKSYLNRSSPLETSS